MQLTVLKAKLHKATVTHAEIEYDNSCATDGEILDRASIHEYEQIDIYNIGNGECFTADAIRAEDRSGIISVNGAVTHKTKPGDRVIICSYIRLDNREIPRFEPTLLYLDKNNNVSSIKDPIPVQAA